ncbi:MAG: mannose-1-phosphate guanylyltransferase [Deltaproteobacteria bacterium]|nr:mannose-1-phosphate guanylyltransferase [Deltaproteobacteria bacterium]
MALHVVIMAGGKGKRLWPLSREDRPKQLLSLNGKGSLLRKTVDRVLPLVAPAQICVVTNSDIADQVMNELPEIPEENIFTEPIARNTAPCIGYAAVMIAQQDPQGTMAVLPSDHVITDPGRFCDALRFGVTSIEQYPDLLITLGIVPNYPETGYGYIAPSDHIYANDSFVLYKVEAFYEKPDRRRAAAYIKKGYLWNSGMFLWRVDTILKAFEEYLSDIYKRLMDMGARIDKEGRALYEFYRDVEAISIDYGIMEKALNVGVIPVEFGWNDVGSWDALGRISSTDGKGNAVQGHAVLEDSWNNVIWATGKRIVLIGVNNMVVVEGQDAILVCPRGRSQDVSKLLRKMKENQD